MAFTKDDQFMLDVSMDKLLAVAVQLAIKSDTLDAPAPAEIVVFVLLTLPLTMRFFEADRFCCCCCSAEAVLVAFVLHFGVTFIMDTKPSNCADMD